MRTYAAILTETGEDLRGIPTLRRGRRLDQIGYLAVMAVWFRCASWKKSTGGESPLARPMRPSGSAAKQSAQPEARHGSPMSLRSKLLLGFLSIVMLASGAGANSIYSVSRLGQLTIDMYDKPLMSINFARAAKSDFMTAQYAVRDTAIADDGSDEEHRETAGSAYEDLLANLDVVAERAYSERSKKLIAEILAAIDVWWRDEQTFLESERLSVDHATASLDEAIANKLDLLIEYESENGYNFRRDAAAAIDLAWWLTIGLGGIVVALGLALAVVLGNRLTQLIRGTTEAMTRLAGGDSSVVVPGIGRRDEIGTMAAALQVFKDIAVEKQKLEEQQGLAAEEIAQLVTAAAAGDLSGRIEIDSKTGFFRELGDGMNDLLSAIGSAVDEVVGMMSALATGDLSRRITGRYQGQLQALKSDANRTADKLAQVVGQTVEGMSAIRNATSELASGATDLSSRTEAQVARLEEIAASVRQLTDIVRHSADNTEQATKLAASARSSAENGGRVADAAVAAMGQIEQSSQRISDIVGMIDDIAFQTNLLALNAAVEAVRAGEAGRGFAVVASEVRALAQRSSHASKDIKALIANSSAQVKQGVQLVNEAGATLSEIVTSVKRVSDIVSGIAEANSGQLTAVHQVQESVAQIEQVTQQNAALVEQSTAALGSVDNQVRIVNEVIGFFSIGPAGAIDSSPTTSSENDRYRRPIPAAAAE
jgi:methyl-accepting chemotaxis protein